MTKKILIIEDNPAVAALLVSELQHAGYEILVAPDAMMGTQGCLRWRPDLVILDLMIPAGGGHAVLKNMKQSVYTSTLPVLVLTGSTDPAVRRLILEFGVTYFLQKPHNAQELLAMIKKAIGRDASLPTP